MVRFENKSIECTKNRNINLLRFFLFMHPLYNSSRIKNKKKSIPVFLLRIACHKIARKNKTNKREIINEIVPNLI